MKIHRFFSLYGLALYSLLTASPLVWGQALELLDDEVEIALPYRKIFEMPQGNAKNDHLELLENELRNPQKVVGCKGGIAGVSDSLILYYASGKKAVFKLDVEDPNDLQDTYYSHPDHEIAAYKIARYFGIERVPPTVRLELFPAVIKGDPKIWRGSCEKAFLNLEKRGLPLVGSVQIFMEGARDIKPFDFYYPHSLELDFFDYLIFNCDRVGSKNLIVVGKEQFYIDHGLAFLHKEGLEDIRSREPDAKYDFTNYCHQILKFKASPQYLCPTINKPRWELLRAFEQGDYHQVIGDLVGPLKVEEMRERARGLLLACAARPPIPVDIGSEDTLACSSDPEPKNKNGFLHFLSKLFK